MRKIFSLLLVLLTVLPIMSACKKTGDNTTTTAKDSALSVSIPKTKVTENSDGTTRLIYEVNIEGGGYISGRESQTLVPSRNASSVTAEAFPGYKFLQWSDGSTEATRENDTGTEGSTTTYYAVFAPEAYEMPMIFIDTETGKDVESKEEYIGGSISVANCDDEYILNDLEMEIRGRGNFSWSLDKKSYRIKLSEQQKLLGIGEGKNKNWVLLANHCDQSLLRNYVTHTFANHMSGIDFAPDCINVEVYLNGKYNGVYLLCESLTINPNRINISEEVESGTDIGYLVQLTEYAEEPTFRIGGRVYEIKNDLSSDKATADSQQQYILSYMNTCWSAVRGGDRAQIESLIDLDSVVDTYIVEEMVKNIDVGWDSFYFYKDAGGKLFFGPIWDFDLAMGNANEGTETYSELLAAQDKMDQSNPWYSTLMSHDWFRALVAERWKSEEVQNIINGLPKLITDTAKANYKSLCRNFETWDIFGQTINRESPYVTSLKNYDEHYQYLTQWVEKRIDWLNNFIGSDAYNGGDNIGPNAQMPSLSNSASSTLNCSGGNGSKSNPYLISEPKDFSSLTRAVLQGETFEGKYFKQTSNLNMNAVRTYSGMGRDGNFAGIYDGCGYSIYAELSGGDQCIFPYLTGLVMNLSTDGSVENRDQAAGICRSTRNGGAVINCSSTMLIGTRESIASGISASINGDAPMILNCLFAGEYTEECNEPSPITNWPDNPNTDTLALNYYLSDLSAESVKVREGCDHAVTAEEMETLADTLNGNLAEAAGKATKYGITEADLCKWENTFGYPTLIVK